MTSPEIGVAEVATEVRVGFACNWDHPDPRATWSHTPWQLRQALRELNDIELVDCGIAVTGFARKVLRGAYARRAAGRWVTVWKFSRGWGEISQRRTAAAVAAAGPHALLEIGDLACVDTPFYVYQDLSYGLLLRTFGGDFSSVPGFPGVSLRMFRRRDARQKRMYHAAAGVFCMSGWFADSLIAQGVAAHKVHVVPPGRTAADIEHLGVSRLKRSRHRLLFVGRDFMRKGGDTVVAALQLARDQRDDLELTVAGPSRWPLPGEPPAGVRFLGPQAPPAVARLMADADLFVMPSRFEAFGIVFAEALASGLPCIGADTCAMPEIIRAPRYGRLLAEQDPVALADLILDALDDDDLYRRCERDRLALSRRYSWETCATAIADIIRSDLGISAI